MTDQERYAFSLAKQTLLSIAESHTSRRSRKQIIEMAQRTVRRILTAELHKAK